MASEVLKTKAEQELAQQFEAGMPNLPGSDVAWTKAMRDAAWQTYAAVGLPHRRVEEWKYTDLRSLLKDAYPPAPALGEALTTQDVDTALGQGAALDSYRVVVVNGHYREELSNLDGLDGQVVVQSLSDALTTPSDWLQATLGQVAPQPDDVVVALNAALMTGGVIVTVAKGAQVEKPVHLVHVAAVKDPAGLATRNVVHVGEGAALTLIESYNDHSALAVQRNAVTELIADDRAEVHHIKFQNENAESTHLSTWMTRLGANVTYRAFQFSAGASVARNQVFVRFAGEGSSSHVSGAVLGRNRQHNDTTMVIDHAVPECESREFFKLVLDDEARGIVQCKVNVHRDAQKSDGHQIAHGLLLSEAAEFDSKPELEIFADDVVCGHGSTSGQVDEDLLFYLRARGIPEPEARALLIEAFVGEALEKIEREDVRNIFSATTSAWLGGKGA
ncbi:MAG: Fe-S cluster assembly protein SufD [Hyphomicrobiaceae bacterium]|nr:Fe-S cluster assembly protein SufD [Hyphomicrobiaceae bacterium]